MEMKTTQKIRKFSNSFVITVPKAYVDDGNLELGTEYEVVFRHVPRRMWGFVSFSGFEPVASGC